MKKQLIVALALSLSVFAFAQKKELKTAEKAIKANNFAAAKTALAAVEPMLGNLDDKLTEKYNYLKGIALYANGAANNEELGEALKLLNKSRGSYKDEVNAVKGKMVNKFLEKANKSYETKNYDQASFYFEKLYNLKRRDTIYLYYAAATAVSVPNYDRALTLYEKLRKLNYDGSEVRYFAVNKSTNKKEVFPSKSIRKASITTKTHIKPTDEKSPSKKADIIKTIATIYITQGKNDKAVEAIEEARNQNPDDVNLVLSQANIYYKMGDKEKFKELMEIATTMDPDNAELQFNLGVISAESEQPTEALNYYNKAIELDPNYINAYINSAALILGKEKVIIEEMNGLGTSSSDDKRYEELVSKRKGLYRDAIPYLTKALEVDSNNQDAAATLTNIYSVLGDTDKYKAMKSKLDAIQNGN